MDFRKLKISQDGYTYSYVNLVRASVESSKWTSFSSFLPASDMRSSLAPYSAIFTNVKVDKFDLVFDGNKPLMYNTNLNKVDDEYVPVGKGMLLLPLVHNALPVQGTEVPVLDFLDYVGKENGPGLYNASTSVQAFVIGVQIELTLKDIKAGLGIPRKKQPEEDQFVQQLNILRALEKYEDSQLEMSMELPPPKKRKK
jgi:hypothetical protein